MLLFRHQTTAGGSQGFVDSTSETFEAGIIDTSVAFGAKCYPNINVPDSLQFISIGIIFDTSIGNPAADDTMYVALDASNDNGQTWRILNSGNIGINGFTTGAASVANTRGSVLFNGKPNSTTNVLGRSPVGLPQASYGGWFGHSLFRVRILGGSGGGNNAARFTAFATYPTQAK